MDQFTGKAKQITLEQKQTRGQTPNSKEEGNANQKNLERGKI